MKPKQDKPEGEALKRLQMNPAPFIIKIKIKEKPDPKKYKYIKDGIEHDMTPPEGAKSAMKKTIKVMELF